ncbi:MAG: enoyl-ACP reductase [Spirochaetaceae bacterium]|nr:MAG: enoyl-ACP reductase [Spirochaetaceae bacterium]
MPALLEGKTALVFGVANDRSIAWSIARQMHAHGAKVELSYASEPLRRRIEPLAAQIGSRFVMECDLTDDAAIANLFADAEREIGTIDILVHAVAYADRAELQGRFSDTSRAGFALAMDVSVYSLVAIARAALPLMNPGASIVTLTYYGGQKVAPNYNVMGVAKAALESATRYLAADLGPQGVRVNAISAGPIRTLSAQAVTGFRTAAAKAESVSPLRRSVDADDVANAAVWLSSDMARNVTGDVLFVDAGYNIMAGGMDADPGAATQT